MPPFHVLIPAAMPPAVVERIASGCQVTAMWSASDAEAALAEASADVRGLAVAGHYGVDARLMERLPRLEIVANFGVGYNNVDVDWAARHDIVVTNTPDVLNDEVADTALGLIIAAVRQLPAAERHLRAGLWPAGNFPLTPTLRGRTLGVLGLGRIGKAIAKRAEAFGMAVVYHGRNPQPGVAYAYCPTVVTLAEACDVLVAVTPGGESTTRLIDGPVLKALGPNGVLINIARGSVVNESALIEALQTKTILAAGLDVFESEPHVPQALIDMDNVVLLPHVGSASSHTRAAMGQLVADNLLSWAAGRGPLTPVAETPWSGRDRAATTR